MLIRISLNYPSVIILKLLPHGKASWGDLDFTTEDVEDFDYLISLNPPYRDITGNCPAENRWLIVQEPPIDEYKWHIKSYDSYAKVFAQWGAHRHPNLNVTHGALPWQLNKSYDQLSELSPPAKNDEISSITSMAYSYPGHRLRWKLLNAATRKSLPFQFFGKGVRFIEDKYDALAPFKYSLAIENSFHPHYWTEKITDCFLSWTMPIYAGAPNITEYFPEESILLINPNKPEESINRIEQAIAERRWEKNLAAIEEARNRVLNKYNIFPWLHRQIQNHDSRGDTATQFTICANKRPSKRELERFIHRVKRKSSAAYLKTTPAYRAAQAQAE